MNTNKELSHDELETISGGIGLGSGSGQLGTNPQAGGKLRFRDIEEREDG